MEYGVWNMVYGIWDYTVASLGSWLHPKIVHKIMNVSAMCHILGHLCLGF